jgi:hypothetical protein
MGAVGPVRALAALFVLIGSLTFFEALFLTFAALSLARTADSGWLPTVARNEEAEEPE